MGSEVGYLPLFETTRVKGQFIYRIFAISVFLGIVLIWVYRVSHVPNDGKWGWLGLLAAELWFGIYWVLTQAVRWNRVHRRTFKDRLSERYENELPGVDIFVCTADPEVEAPMMVMDTILSVMAYEYPTEKLSVYLSDDAASELTFYAMLESSQFARHWLPFCKKFRVEPRSPSAYFYSAPNPHDPQQAQSLAIIKKLYDDMKNRIETATKLGGIPEEEHSKHEEFSQWDTYSSRRDHDTIFQIIIDGGEPNAVDIDGYMLPTLVYLAREKRPQHFHNFKAGAMNALIRVSSKISNGPIILNVDCDMYSHDSLAVRDALSFFMDEEKGHEIAYVQFSHDFQNVTRNDIYGTLLSASFEVELHGMDAYGGPLYIGSGTFHRRNALCGRKISKESRVDGKGNNMTNAEHVHERNVEQIKTLASCAYERNTLWGMEMGLRYGCLTEDVLTGLAIHIQGWKSMYYNPKHKAFVGFGPTTLPQVLLQQKRWAEGHLQIFLSKNGPLYGGYGKISTCHIMAYCIYNLWASNCLATLYYTIIPSLYLVRGIPLFPEISSLWFTPFVYVISAKYFYSLFEFLWSGGTILGWWNDQRMWLYKRTSSYFFAFIDTILKLLGILDSPFLITAKVADRDVTQRFEKEVLEFGISSPMLTVLATLALLNLSCFAGVMVKVATVESVVGLYEAMALQIILCCILIFINLPLYAGLFIRKDKGRVPSSTAFKSLVSALIICTCLTYWY